MQLNATPPTTTTTETTTDMTPSVAPRVKICAPGFICEHGYCVFPSNFGMFCVCDQGYIGLFCTQVCPLECGERAYCRKKPRFSPQDPHECVCKDGFYGPDCKTTETQKVIAVPENSTEVAPLAERRQATNDLCHIGFTCIHGNCSNYDASDGLECLCEPGYTGFFCHVECRLDCGPNSVCRRQSREDEAKCVCLPGFTGYNCTRYVPPVMEGLEIVSSDNDVLWLVSAVSAAVVLCVLGLGVSLYVMWWRRNVTLMRIVYWFRDFEEDDGREFDAFVSFASSDWDLHFVIHQMLPRLEKEQGFHLCIHQRNFEPGLYIADNITEAVTKSRRTLMLVTQDFVTSTWCRFEYQVALKEMLSERHRIIPVMAGDVTQHTEGLDDTLKQILHTVTWLTYPGDEATQKEKDKFWQRLTLSMPKKRPPSSQPTDTEVHDTHHPAGKGDGYNNGGDMKSPAEKTKKNNSLISTKV